MPVKAVPVEAAEEAGEPPKPPPEEPVAAETKEEDVPEKPAPKAKSRAKAKAKPLTAKAAESAERGSAKAAESAERGAAKAQVASDKAAEKAKKEQEKVDMKARVKCPVCHRTVSQHCLLYTHKCSQAALDKKPKTPTVEEKFETKEVEQEEEPVAPKKKPKKVRYVPGDSDEEPGPGAPSFSDRLYERGDEEFLGYPQRVPPPPPLVRQQAYAPQAYQPYQPSYREQLIMRQRERQHQQALSQVAPIRRLFKR